MQLDERFIVNAVPGVTFLAHKFPSSMSFSIDTRTMQPGDIYVAIPGARVDGHDFVADAFKRGAAGIIAQQDKQHIFSAIPAKMRAKKLIMLVPDTQEALCQLAAAWRAQFSYPVVAITGSVGKTSTKQVLAAMLEAHGVHYLASRGNQNTRLGVSLNILRMQPDHEMAIFEVGISRRGEMAHLVSLLRPTTGVITGIGHAHMEGLGSLADIALEKRDLFKYFTEHNIGIINGDQPLLARVSYAHPVIKFGTKTTNQIQARKIKVTDAQVTFVLKLYKEKKEIQLTNPHQGAVFNALAATAVAHQLGISAEAIVQGIQKPVSVSGRFEQRTIKAARGTIINDCYNANPESMKAALLAFQQVNTEAQKIAVIGDMLELGVNSPFWHRQLGRFLRKVPSLSHLILVGSLVSWTKKTAPLGLSIDTVPTWQEAVKKLEQRLQKKSVVLVKGSHGMSLDNLVNHFSEQ
jgi:UDP-N-acetylmuramoyl-tripeptide--D-alanyl-D-alanine ligase